MSGPGGPGPIARAVRFARMAGTSMAAPDAAPWVTDFLNAAYYARPEAERHVDDLRLAFCVLTTRWSRLGGRRLHLTDLRAFHRAYRRRRFRRDGGRGRLTRADLLEGGDRLLGPWFSGGYADPARRGWGIVFESASEREAHRPERRMAHAKVGALTPPSAPPGRRVWKTYEPVPVADVDLMMERLTAPASWPDFGSDHGRFTPLRPGGLLGQTFEIEVVAGAGTRHPLLTRGYVTCTRLENGDRPEGLESLVAEMDAGLAGVGARTLPDGHHAVAVAQLTTHAGHFMGPGLSHLVVSAGPGGAALRDVGSWDPMRFPMSLAYRLGGKEAQRAFWGERGAANSLLHQLAAP
ncbi:MAG: hypothetical protein ACAH79_09595 [Thermoleophilia bacterium]